MTIQILVWLMPLLGVFCCWGVCRGPLAVGMGHCRISAPWQHLVAKGEELCTPKHVIAAPSWDGVIGLALHPTPSAVPGCCSPQDAPAQDSSSLWLHHCPVKGSFLHPLPDTESFCELQITAPAEPPQLQHKKRRWPLGKAGWALFSCFFF